MAMLAVATRGGGIERVIDPGDAPATAAIRGESAVVTADADGMLRVWRPSKGTLLGQVKTPEPLSALADTWPGSSIAGATSQGEVALIDVSDPHLPRFRWIGRVLPPGERLLALSFAEKGSDVLALGAGGMVVRLDANTGHVISRWSLREIGFLDDQLRAAPGLAAASYEVDSFGGEEDLLVGTGTGAVVRVDLQTKQGRLLLAPGLAPGRITSVAREAYGRRSLTIGATGGEVIVERPGVQPFVVRGRPLTAVVADEIGNLWRGSEEGVEVKNEEEEEAAPLETAAGQPVRELSKGEGGVVAITLSGEVELLGQVDSGIALEEAATTPVVAFDPDGDLLAAEGFDANHIEELVALEPGHGLESGTTVFNPKVRSYRPDPSWWPDAEEGAGLYVNNVVSDSEFVAAGGQDPTGTAAVLLWDRKSGDPVRRLILSTGGVETGVPSIVSDLVLLPGRHMIAAYSALQQQVTVWSTDTWQRVAVIPVGFSGELSLSPDESTLLVATLRESTEEGDPGDAPSKLTFVDTDSWSVEREVRTPDTFRAAWSPDGGSIATLGDDGMLRFWSPDGSDEVRRPLQLEGSPLALAWRPDGSSIAVSIEEAGIVVVDPNSGEVSTSLPGSTFSSPLAWSPDGDLLAAATSHPAEGEGEYRIPDAAQLWTLGPARLARRMCQLAGGPLSPADWRRLVDPDLPPRPLCPASRISLSQPAPVPRTKPILAYQSGHGLFVADERGQATQVGAVEEEAYPPVSFAWSDRGLAWFGSDQVGVLLDGARHASWWPCRCAGVAWIGSSAFALESDGRGLLRFTPGQRWPRHVTVEGSLGQEPSVLGSLHGALVIAGYLGTPARGTPNGLFLVAQDGSVRRVGGPVEGVLLGPTATAPAGNEVAFTSSRSGGACYFSTKVGVLSLGPAGRPQLRFP
ncbi:MAG TPA: hypothetical protein VFP21_10920, partial [Solirubrobacterales bacterium]|nr:hypothetical protein [Solirubrobacterales bacterium]